MINLKNLAVIISLSFTTLVFSMEKKKETKLIEPEQYLIDLPMVEIKKYKELEPYAGSIVAYKSESFYFGAKCSPFSKLHYCYIPKYIQSHLNGSGLQIKALIRPDGLNMMRILSNYYIEKEGPFFLRAITLKEIETLRNLIYLKKCHFDYHDSIKEDLEGIWLEQIRELNLIENNGSDEKTEICDNDYFTPNSSFSSYKSVEDDNFYD